MIGVITPPPISSNGCIDYNNDIHLERKPLINQVTGSVINVKNTNTDFRIVSKELSLYSQVKYDNMLATVADTTLHNNQNTRFSSLGMAVTAVYNLVENGKAKEKSVDICNRNTRDQSVEFNSDFALTKRGQEFINQFLNAKTPLDPTNYAIGLRVGSDIKNNVLDTIMINKFNSTWNIRLDMST